MQGYYSTHKVGKYLLLHCMIGFLCIAMTTDAAGQDTIKKDTSTWDIDLKDVVITAQYAPISAENAIHEVKVLDAEQLRSQGYSTLDEALRNQLNMRISTDPMLGNSLKIQGVDGQHIKIMIDGVPIIGRLNGNIDLSQIPLNTVRRIEIVEGALSTIYGSNASGGVINIITKKSIEKNISINMEGHIENVGLGQGNINLAGRYKKLTARVGINYYKSQFAPIDSLRLYEDIDLGNGNTSHVKKIPWNPKEQLSAHASFYYHFTDSTKLSYSYRSFDEEVNMYGEVRRPQYKPYAYNDRFSTERQDHSLHLESYLGKKWYLKNLLSYNRYKRLSEKIREDIEIDSFTSLPENRDTSNFFALLHRSTLSYVSDKWYNGAIGIEYLYEGGTGERLIDSSSQKINRATMENLALWASFRYTGLKDFKAQVSLRYGYNSHFSHPLLPALHLSWDISPFWNLKFSYAHGYRAPALKELFYRFIDVNHYILGNPELQAEKSRNIALIVGYKRIFAGRHELDIKAKAFYNNIYNSIVLAQYDQLKYTYLNIDNYETHGINLNVNYTWNNKLELRSGIAYTRILNSYAAESNQTYLHQIELQNTAVYHLPEINLSFYLSHKYVGNEVYFYLDSADKLHQATLGAYNYLDASAKYTFFKEQCFLTLGVKNILDVTAIAIAGPSQGTHSGAMGQQIMSWGRSIFASVGLNLNYDL